MRSSEGSSDGYGKLPLPVLLTALALGACHDQDDEIAQIQENLEQGAREVREAEERSKEESLRLRAEAEALPEEETAAADALDYDDSICVQVRATKATLDKIDYPVRSGKGARSRIVDTKSRRGADGTRSDSVLVASGSGTPQDIRNRADAVQRFFDAARLAGGLRNATDICLRRSGSRGQ